MFKYKVNSRLMPQLILLHKDKEGSFSIDISKHTEKEKRLSDAAGYDADPVRYPLFKNTSKRKNRKRFDGVKIPNKNNEENEVVEPINGEDIEPTSESELQINIELDFGWLFGWLERCIWLTMAIGVTWALAYDFKVATREVCLMQIGENETSAKIDHYPFNVLPSLSRSMSSFQLGKFLWTITMAAAFVSRLLSNHFLHRLYQSWYDDYWFNNIFLGLAYLLDTLEIVTLLMIPAFSLDCDPNEHSIFFRTFICLTFAAEILQYMTRFLRRKKGMVLFSDDVNNYYRQIGILILLQMVFIAFMMTGYILHDRICHDYVYSIFALGEYITVIINVRFKRDTILFVK